MSDDLGPVIEAAGVIARSPQGRSPYGPPGRQRFVVFPGGKLKEGETAERAAWREFAEEVGYKLGGLKFLMRRVKSDGPDGVVDYSTFVSEVPEEFLPKLNHEGSAFAWLDPSETFNDAKASDSSGAVSRSDITARADAVPVVGGQGHAELEASLNEGFEQDERERVAGQDNDLEAELAASEEGPAAPAPLYPVADEGEGQGPLGDEDQDDDDIPDDVLDLALSVISDLEARLERLEEGVRDDAVPVQDRKAAQGIGRRFRF